MEEKLYVELIEQNMLVSKCCVCSKTVGYKEAGRCLEIGDEVISHTYCTGCYKEVMNIDQDEFIDGDY